jgi:hypothetical protein
MCVTEGHDQHKRDTTLGQSISKRVDSIAEEQVKVRDEKEGGA